MAVTATHSPFANVTESSSGDGALLACRPPAVPCLETSDKFHGFCDHGICCFNERVNEEYCACTEKRFTGLRCDIFAELAMPSTEAGTTAIICVFVFLVLAITAFCIGFIIYRRRQRNSQYQNRTIAIARVEAPQHTQIDESLRSPFIPPSTSETKQNNGGNNASRALNTTTT